MKIRQGFVSNSSSSSFTCNVCNYNITERDLSILDTDMWQCEGGHTFCEEHMIGDITPQVMKDYMLDFLSECDNREEEIDKITKMTDAETEEYFRESNDYRYEMRYEIPSSLCPICGFKEINTDEAVKYLLKKDCLTMAELMAEVKKEFSNYDEFLAYIKGNEDED